MRIRMPEWLRANKATEKPLASGELLAMAAVIDIAADAAGADGKPKLPTFKIDAYNGGIINVAGFYWPVVVDLSGLKAAGKTIPILIDHDISRPLGQAEQISIEASSVKLTGVITGVDPEAQRVVGHAKNGFKWQSSIGAGVYRKEFLEAGATAQVNGQTFTGPLIIARESILREVSVTAVGADPTTSASVAASASPEKDTMLQFTEWLKAKGFDPATITDVQKVTLKATYDAEKLAAAAPPVVPAGAAVTTTPAPVAPAPVAPATLTAQAITEMRAQFAAETTRVAKIQATCAGHNEIAAKAIAEGWTVEKAELEVLRAARPQAPAPMIGRSGGDSDRINAMAIEASLCLTAGLREQAVAASFPQAQREQVMNAAASRPLRGAGLHHLMGMVIQAAGQHYAGDHRNDDFIRAAFQADNFLRASGFSTVSLSQILENAANKALIAAYTAAEVVWPTICGVRSHRDFKIHSRYRLDVTGSFKKIGADGELKSISLSDAKYTNQIDTVGAIVALTRQMIINDDLGSFMELPAMLGRLSALRKEEAVFVLLLSNPSNFFHANNKNLITGGSSALSIDALTAAEQKFLDMVDANGKPVLVTPKFLLVPTALKVTADNLMSEKLIIDGTATAKQPAKNPHAGKYAVRCSPYLNNTAITDQNGAAITGQSATGWYLGADPAQRAAIAIAFLNGKQQPTIESAQTDFATLGMQWRAFDDFGVGMEETTAAVKSNGA